MSGMRDLWLRVVYVTAPTGTVHVTHGDDGQVTACGKVVQPDWERGDESLSGIAATCGMCRRLVTRSRPVVSR